MPDKPRNPHIREHPYEPVETVEDAREYHLRLDKQGGKVVIEIESEDDNERN